MGRFIDRLRSTPSGELIILQDLLVGEMESRDVPAIIDALNGIVPT